MRIITTLVVIIIDADNDLITTTTTSGADAAGVLLATFVPLKQHVQPASGAHHVSPICLRKRARGENTARHLPVSKKRWTIQTYTTNLAIT